MNTCWEAFAGDKYIEQEFRKLSIKFNINTIIETGTNKGHTALSLSKIFGNVYTIELNSKYAKKASEKFKNNDNIYLLQGNSPDVLDDLIPDIIEYRPLMFFLDAHWYDYNPLLDELEVIRKYGLDDSIITIHDFKVPNKNFGYDQYREITYEWKYIEDIINKIYKKNYYKYYNEKAMGAKRGIIYITPEVNK